MRPLAVERTRLDVTTEGAELQRGVSSLFRNNERKNVRSLSFMKMYE
jgi:hypothetical protein